MGLRVWQRHFPDLYIMAGCTDGQLGCSSSGPVSAWVDKLQLMGYMRTIKTFYTARDGFLNLYSKQPMNATHILRAYYSENHDIS